MAENSAIEWTDHTFNPWIGCTKVSPGCDHCYAERREDKRLHRVQWGAGQPRQRTKTWGDPVRWNKQPFFECLSCRWRGPDSATITIDNPAGLHPPASWARGCPACRQPTVKSTRARVFCASLADVFDNEVPPEWRADLFDLIAATPHLDWLLLTKRIGNVARMVREQNLAWPENAALGFTAVNQEELNRDWRKAASAAMAVRPLHLFVSIEPMLGAMRLDRVESESAFDDWTYSDNALTGFQATKGGGFDGPRLDWVICGGESGPGARPMHPDWARSLMQHCRQAGVAFMMKQMGGVRDKRGTLDDLPEDLRVREFPHAA